MSTLRCPGCNQLYRVFEENGACEVCGRALGPANTAGTLLDLPWYVGSLFRLLVLKSRMTGLAACLLVSVSAGWAIYLENTNGAFGGIWVFFGAIWLANFIIDHPPPKPNRDLLSEHLFLSCWTLVAAVGAGLAERPGVSATLLIFSLPFGVRALALARGRSWVLSSRQRRGLLGALFGCYFVCRWSLLDGQDCWLFYSLAFSALNLLRAT